MRKPGVFSLAVLVCVLLPAVVHAQYFGQNRVRYQTFDFQVLETQHFDIHFYPEAKEPAEMAGRMAERWYTRFSTLLNHELRGRQPLVMYADHPAFRATTVIPGFIGESTGGVTEGLRRRIVMPFAGPLAETDHVLGHELVHAFQFDITSGMGQGGLPAALSLPLWFVEGMAEYLSLGPVDSNTAMWLRDAARRDELPTVRQLNNPRYFPYRYGHAFWAYVGGRYGDEVIGRLFRQAARHGPEDAIQQVLEVSPQEFSEQWHAALRQQFDPVLRATVPIGDEAHRLIARSTGGGELNVSPAVSPDGRHILFFSERALFSIDIYVADAETGRIRRRITETAVDPHHDSLQFVNSAGAWSADSRRFAYVTVSQGRPQLAIYDMEAGSVVQRITLRELGEVFNPTWSPDGRHIALSGLVGGLTDLFILDLETEGLRRLTSDAYAALHPAWSPDGSRIAFVTDRFTTDLGALAFGQYELALIDPQTGGVQRVRAFQTGRHTNPQWSRDGNSLLFIGDPHGIPNIYRLYLDQREVRQVTNLQGGVSGIAPLSPAFSLATQTERLVFSAREEEEYQIFRIEAPEVVAGIGLNQRLAALSAAALPPRERAAGAVAQALQSSSVGLVSGAQFEVTPYRAGLGLDYIAPPAIGVGVSNVGTSVGGGTALYFSDLLGYHNLMVALQGATTTTTGPGNFLNNLAGMVGYQNQRSRWTWGIIGGQMPFLTGGYGRGTAVIDGQPAIVEQEQLVWEINRELAGTLMYPFSRAQRIEFAGGYRNIAFAGETRTRAFSTVTGELLIDDRQTIPTPDSLHLGTGAAALVYDTSVFGGTSPWLGQRYRLELGGMGGSLNFATGLADYRRYFQIARPLSIAGRVLHFGRYGAGGEDSRLQPMFLGYPSLVRGYEPATFRAEECQLNGAEDPQQCPAFDRLLGSRILVGNAEARLGLLGPLGIIPSRRAPPLELAAFYDTGVAWLRGQSPSFLGGERGGVSSYGAAARINIFGFAIGQVSYAIPMDRPLRDHVWQFALLPGF